MGVVRGDLRGGDADDDDTPRRLVLLQEAEEQGLRGRCGHTLVYS